MDDGDKITIMMFEFAQRPRSWMSSADALRDGAEAILATEQTYALPYIRAHNAAIEKASEIACADGNESGMAEIDARVPNYPVAELLYAYALENLLKGMIVAKMPTLISREQLDKKLTHHDLVKLSAEAGFDLWPQEVPIAQGLSLLSIWAARYPVAKRPNDHAAVPNPNDLLDYGAQHVTMRKLFDRCRKELMSLGALEEIDRREAIVVLRPAGTSPDLL